MSPRPGPPPPPRRGRSHPPSLIRLAERLIRDERLLARGDVVLCACSGGPDSSALLHVLALLRRRIGHEVVAHGVDHGLRAAAASELSLARDLAARLGVPFSTTRVDVAPGANLQARARAARFAALASAAAARGARAIATGHTADDRAETVLLRLLRGAGPRGLAVLPPRAPLPVGAAGPARDGAAPGSTAAVELIRPLLLARRADVLAHLGRHRLAFAEDPSNADPRFARVRVRRELLPLLEDLSPAIVEHLCALSDMLAAGREPPPGGDADVLDGEKSLSVPLGRAQRLAIERARKLGRPLRVRVRGGREIAVGFPEESSVLIEDESVRRGA
ncbi:tRNA(Ile)-lysidine synthetase [Sorangium cellulosum]|uniref:tRNA(Ile)-lysidine synthase n=1 Tax=Sorangium cellulosum TaxID=56 RepID=A0A4P2Q9L9_SORCE|nr:tRNA lysidine(34) synthetase TilS [Sorangium cellulosum]AUX25951.1 tRNA(Ile)-lysidine synthetase [Sorangium cellulosum]